MPVEPGPLGNYIRIGEGETVRLHLVDHAVADREITDPTTGLRRPVTVLTFVVDEVEGRPQAASWSVTSAALAAELWPLLPDRAYRALDLLVTRRGSGFATQYQLLRIPRPSA